MNQFARAPAAPFLDQPGRRLVWTLPMAALIWLALLIGFAHMLELTAAPPPEIKPLEARIVELPPEVGGLQSTPAPAAAKHQPVVKPAPIVHPHPIVHPRVKLRPTAPPVAPSESGTAKSTAPPATTAPTNPQGTAGTGASSTAGLGSDNAGARALYAPAPTIPDDLRQDALETVAVAHFKVGYDGQVEVELTKPTSNPELNQILIDTLKQWKFFPAMRNGVAIASEFDVRIPITVQ